MIDNRVYHHIDCQTQLDLSNFSLEGKIMAKIPTKELRSAGLRMMEKRGTPLTKRPGRKQIYEMTNSEGEIETVRLKSNNGQILMVKSDGPHPEANLNIDDDTDWILLIIPQVQNDPKDIIGFLIPTKSAVERIRKSHKYWLESTPNTAGNNRTWKLEFNEYGSGKYRLSEAGRKHIKYGWALFATWDEHRLG